MLATGPVNIDVPYASEPTHAVDNNNNDDYNDDYNDYNDDGEHQYSQSHITMRLSKLKPRGPAGTKDPS